MSQAAPLYIIDGSSYIFRAYYAIRHLSNSKGIPTNATYGFTQMLLKLIKDEKPDHLVMVFDSKEPSFRKKEYDAYKANRELPPEDLVPQFDYIKRVVRALNIPVLEKPGFEADDIIATVVRRMLPKGHPAVIVTGDKDLMQLVDGRVQLLDTMKDKRTDVAGVREKFGVTPEQVVDVLALAGDSSDNVPGVFGIGAKTASQLIQEYGTLEDLYKKVDGIAGKKGENLRQHREQAFLSKRLVTLCDEVPLNISYEDFAVRSPHPEECRKLFEELEFTQLSAAFGEAPKETSRADYGLVATDAAFKKFLQKLSKNKVFAFDTETTSLNVSQAELVGVSFAFKAGEAYYLPVGHETGEGQLVCAEVIRQIKPFLEDAAVQKYAQNYKYDVGVLQKYGIQVRGLSCDTLLASYLLDPASSHKLDNLSLKFLGHKMISYSEVTEQKGRDSFAKVPLEEAKNYSAEDADVTFQLAELFLKKIKEQKLYDLLVKVEQPLTEVLLKMEGYGVKVDMDFLRELQKDFGERIKRKEKAIYELAGQEFNIQSPKQLGHILFEKLKLPAVKKTKTGYSTNVDVLTELSRHHGLPQEILDYRSLAKLQSTYVDALLALCDPKTHRVHTHFNQTIAETGRLSSSDPNLQNIPIRTEDGAKIRRAFVAEPGFEILSADYSQIELRVLAHLSRDAALLEAFHKEEDVHRLTAASIFQLNEADVTSAMRSSGKTVNFAVIYGQSPFGLSNQLGVTQREAKKYIENYFAKYQGVKKYRDAVLAEARKTQEVRTLLGRRRAVPDINSKNVGVRGFAERIAFNSVIQGTAADIIKMAMVDLDKKMAKKNLESRMLLQVHDELVFEVKKSEVAVMEPLIREAMEGAVRFEIPLKVEIGIGANWGEAH